MLLCVPIGGPQCTPCALNQHHPELRQRPSPCPFKPIHPIQPSQTSPNPPQVIAWLEAQGCGAKQVNYKLRDWLFARQRWVRLLCLEPVQGQQVQATGQALREAENSRC